MKFCLIVLILLLPISSFGAGYTGAGDIRAVSSIYRHNGELRFELFGSWANKDGCSKADRWYIGASGITGLDDDEVTKSRYSMLLAAYLAGKSIEMYVVGCDSTGRPIVANVYIPSRF